MPHTQPGQVSTVTTPPRSSPRLSGTVNPPQERLRTAVGRLALPLATPTNPCFTRSGADVARAAFNIETWLKYLPRNCVRAMVLDGWHWTT